MQTDRARGAPPDAHAAALEKDGAPNWEGAHLFLEIVRRGSFRAAAEALHKSESGLRRQFTDFERDLGLQLLVRSVSGVTLTPEGERVLAAAQQMEAAYFGMIRARNASSSTLSGHIRLGVTEGLGTFWIGPRLIEFQKAFPNLTVNMHCTMTPADVLRLEADVSVQLMKPEAPDLKVVRIGRVHAMPFAARDYLNLYGTPASLADLGSHRIVLQELDQVNTMEAFRALYPDIPKSAIISFVTNTSSSHYWNIAKGAGIGMLPTYANAMGAAVVPVDLDLGGKRGLLRVSHDIWLTYHPDNAKAARVRELITWIKAAFSHEKYPWFGDEFRHPRNLPHVIANLPVTNLFAGFLGHQLEP